MKKYYIWIPLFVTATATYLFADMASRVFFKLSNVTGKASSVLKEKGQAASFYAPDKAVDYEIKTAWCEGKADDGIGESLELKFKPVYTGTFIVGHGILVNRTLYNENNRIKDYELQISLKNGKTETITGSFNDTSCGKSDDRVCMTECGGMGGGVDQGKCDACMSKLNNTCYPWEVEYQGMSGEAIELNALKCITGLKLTIKSVYHGTKYKDTCISEISPSVGFGGVSHRTNLSDYEKMSDSEKERFKPQIKCEFDK